MNQSRTNRTLAAIFSTDVVGCSRMMEENKKLISKIIEDNNGRVVDSPGDNLIARLLSPQALTEGEANDRPRRRTGSLPRMS